MPLLLKLVLVVAALFGLLALFVGPRRAWELWRAFGQVLGDLIARVAMTIFYFTVFVPFALVARLSHDALDMRDSSPPYWRRLDPESDSFERARKQH